MLKLLNQDKKIQRYPDVDKALLDKYRRAVHSKLVMKAVDIFGYDTMTIVEVGV